MTIKIPPKKIAEFMAAGINTAPQELSPEELTAAMEESTQDETDPDLLFSVVSKVLDTQNAQIKQQAKLIEKLIEYIIGLTTEQREGSNQEDLMAMLQTFTGLIGKNEAG